MEGDKLAQQVIDEFHLQLQKILGTACSLVAILDSLNFTEQKYDAEMYFYNKVSL